MPSRCTACKREHGRLRAKSYADAQRACEQPPRMCPACAEITERNARGSCKPCARRSARAAYYRDPVGSVARAREWERMNQDRLNTPERIEQRRASAVERARKWREANPGADSAASRRWQEANPESVRRNAARYRARKLDALIHDVPEIMVWEFNPAGPGCCNYCACELSFKDRRAWHIDHVIPLARGGMHEIGNLVIACASCNLRKHDRTPDEWAA